MQKGETLIDTAMTLNAMRPDILVVRHHAAGAVELLAQKVDCSVINAGDGSHEHPTQALLDALTIRRAKGRIAGLTVAICGDILHSRVARSNIILLNTLGARVRVIAPSTLLPAGIERLGVEVFADMREGLKDADIVMMLRLQRERMHGAFVPSTREYFHFFGLDHEKLARAKPDALVMHPGPMNRGVEIDFDRRRRPAQRHPRAGRDGRRRAHGGAGGARPAPAQPVMPMQAAAHDSNGRRTGVPQRAPRSTRHAASTRRAALLIEDGMIADLRPGASTADSAATPRSSTAPATCSAPGLIDMRVFTGEPGQEHRETLVHREPRGGRRRRHHHHLSCPTPSRSSTTWRWSISSCAAPATRPSVNVHPMAAMTKGLQGRGDDRDRPACARPAPSPSPTARRAVADAQVMRSVLAYAKDFGALIVASDGGAAASPRTAS